MRYYWKMIYNSSNDEVHLYPYSVRGDGMSPEYTVIGAKRWAKRILTMTDCTFVVHEF